LALTEAQRLCIECRKCCVDVQIDTAYENSDREAIEFYRKRGFQVIKGEDGYLVFEIAYPCPQLRQEGCGIYARRPKVCREYSGERDYGEGCLLSGLKGKRRGKRKSPAA
jgi:Fe-S-cluster containining protein